MLQRAEKRWGKSKLRPFKLCLLQLKSVNCLACVTRAGRVLCGSCQSLASWILGEREEISCRAVKEVDGQTFRARGGAKVFLCDVYNSAKLLV